MHTYPIVNIEKTSKSSLIFPGVRLSTDEVDSPVWVYFLSAALAFTTILSVLLAFSVYKLNKRSCQCTGNCYSLNLTASIECIVHLNNMAFILCVTTRV